VQQLAPPPRNAAIAVPVPRAEEAAHVGDQPLGAIVALTFRSAVDDPARFTSSKKVGPWAGLTQSRNQSGERDVSGGITKAGNVNLRRALCQAATVMMHRGRST
jgi:transposase